MSTGQNLRTFDGVPEIDVSWRYLFGAAFAPDGNTITAVFLRGHIIGWDCTTGQRVQQPPYWEGKLGPWVAPGENFCLAYRRDGKMLATGTQYGFTLIEVATGKCVAAKDASNGADILAEKTTSAGLCFALTFSPDGKTLATASTDGLIKLWDVDAVKCVQILKGHAGAVAALAFHPDGKILASGGVDGKVLLWDPATGAIVDTFKGHTNAVNAVTFSPTEPLLASGSLDRTIRLWPLSPAGKTPATK
jgi:WD40 repeat protein